MLVEDVAHDLLDEVFQRHEAGHGAALVDDDRHVEAPAPHLAEEVLGALELGHEDRRAQIADQLERLFLRVRDVEQVLDVEDPDDVVGVLPVDGIAAVPVLAARGLDLREGRGDRQEDDPRAGHHRFLDRRLPEREDGVQKLALLALDAALFAREVDDALDVVAGDVRRRVGAERAEDPSRDGREKARHGREQAHEKLDRADEEERHLLGAPRRERLGRHLRDDEEQHGRQDRRDENAPLLAEGRDREAGAERARGGVRERVADEERSERARQIVPHPLEPLGALSRPEFRSRKTAASERDVIAVSAEEKNADAAAQRK